MSVSEKSSVVVPAPTRPAGSPLASVKHVIAVGSGKGGVGKSTTAVNLAVALSSLGAKVGLLDADIYGPSVPKLLGGQNHFPTEDEARGRIIPPVVHGLKVMSMGMLGQGNEAPVIWRGPMASKAVSQLLGEVDWGELDYLLIDLPPGTGDIQITLAQAARLSGALIVMTPQGLAGEIAKRGLKMFQQVRVPVIGIVENMSDFVCPECGHVSHIFKQGGGEAVAKELGLPLLARIPLEEALVTESDEGKPVVIDRPESDMAQRYLELARKMAAELSTLVAGGREAKPVVTSFEPNAQAHAFKINWSDGKQSLVTFRKLRGLCPCALCVDENTGVRKVSEADVRADITPRRVNTVGNYALQIHWSDGHETGLYSYDYLRRVLTA